MASRNYRSWVEGFVPPVLRGITSGVQALLFDMLAEGMRQAVRASWIGDPRSVGPAYDALGVAGRELLLPQYAAEDWSEYHARLQRAWEDWSHAGDESSIIGQLGAAGHPGALIYTARHWPAKPPAPYWSQFWVFFPIGTHPITGPGPAWGSFSWGDGTIYGPTGITAAQLATIRTIVRKWKSGRWVCRALVFEISGWTYGTGHTWGEAGLQWGGETARVGV